MGKFNHYDRSGSRKDFGQRDFGRRSFGDRDRVREMHKAVCSNCGRNCEVPFEPTGSRPVYCNDCFKKNGGETGSRRFQDSYPRKPDFERRYESRPQNNEQFEMINRKLDKMLEILKSTIVKKDMETKAKPKELTIIGQKKAKTSKKKTPVLKKII